MAVNLQLLANHSNPKVQF